MTDKKPHIVNHTGNNEWYTPKIYIDAARAVLGTIDLDPASSEIANRTVKATVFYDEETNGLDKPWFGNIWLNPPYQRKLIVDFIDKLLNSKFNQCIVLVNNATETEWFSAMIEQANAFVFTSHRIKFLTKDGIAGRPLQGSVFVYFGDNPEKFMRVFGPFGWGDIL